MANLTKAAIAQMSPLDINALEKTSWSSFFSIQDELSTLIDSDAVVLHYDKDWTAIVYTPSSKTVQAWSLEAEYGEYDGSEDYEEALEWKLSISYTPE